MKRDTVKTIIGLVIIAAIVAATFWYGNAQRQAQLRRDSDAKKQQTLEATASPAVSAPAQTATTGGTGANTAPVNTPSSNSIQGGATPNKTIPATTGNSNGQVNGAATTVPVTGGSAQLTAGTTPAGAGLPDTGAPVAGLLGLGAIIASYVWLKQSQRRVLAASRVRR